MKLLIPSQLDRLVFRERPLLPEPATSRLRSAFGANYGESLGFNDVKDATKVSLPLPLYGKRRGRLVACIPKMPAK
jgi:hypothetical protein